MPSLLAPILLKEYDQPLPSLKSAQFIALKLISASAAQPENAASSMFVTPEGIVILSSELQFLNALLPILVTLEGIAMFVRLVQP